MTAAVLVQISGMFAIRDPVEAVFCENVEGLQLSRKMFAGDV